jgi:hypothetical protein
MIAFLLLSLFLIAAILSFLHFFALCSKLIVLRHTFERRKIVYRIVKGNESALAKEQRVFTRRARSLWRKEMLGWDTFRITFRDCKDYGIFGIVVPDSFELDSDCLEELGFTLGFLEEVEESAVAEMPLRVCYARRLNQLRAARAFAKFWKGNGELAAATVFAEFRNRKQKKVAFVRPISRVEGLWHPPTG